MTTVLPRPRSVNRPSPAVSTCDIVSLTHCHWRRPRGKSVVRAPRPLGTLAVMTTVGTPLPRLARAARRHRGLSDPPADARRRGRRHGARGAMRAARRRRGAHRGGRHRRRLAAPRVRSRVAVGGRPRRRAASSRTPRSTRAAGPTRPSTRHYRGRGIGTALSHWTRAVAARDGGTLVGQPVPGDSPAERLLASLGYRTLWTSWVLQMPAGRAIDPQPVPEGYVIRRAARRGRPASDVDRQRGRLPRVVRPRAHDLRGVGGERVATARLRAVAAAPHGRPAMTRSSAWPSSWSRAAAPTSTSSPVRRDERGKGLAAPCSWTPSRWAERMVGSGRAVDRLPHRRARSL